jgi:uncharacterized membrane protein HdeD (DUF308 family)
MNNEKERAEENAARKITALNEIFEDVISDASDLIKDLSWSVKTYLIFGLIMILFGISEFANNAEVMQERYYIPLFVAWCLLFAGIVQIIQYLRLRKKYSRLFEIQANLKKS